MSFHLGQYLDVPVLFNPTVLNSSPYMTAQRLGVNCFISGDGMDRCYGYLVGHGCEREATFGEDFHAFFPLVDKFLKTIPTRYKYYRSEYTAWDSSHEKELLLAKQYDVCVKKYSRHPSFIHFFEQYEKNVRDIVFPKLLTFQYAADGLGMPYYRFVRRVIRQHKNCFDPFFYRFFSHVTDRGLVFNANKLDKLYAESDRGGV